MPLMKFTGSVAANSTNTNVLNGSTFEFMKSNAQVQFAVLGSATGLVATVRSGSDTLMEESPISTQNRFGIYPDDFDLDDVAEAGDRLIVSIRNTTAGALTYFVTVKVDEI